MVELLEQHLYLLLGAEAGQSRFAVGAYGFWRAHVHALLVDGGVPEPEGLTDALLAPLAPEVYDYQRNQRGLEPAQIASTLDRLARRVLPAPDESDPGAKS